ncbi:MAG: ribonuclease activity regulator RraA [Chloroflexota bacterium]|jgi:regulator of RNase E activity RraA
MTIFNPDKIRDITVFTDIQRPDPALCEALSRIGSATTAGELFNLGVTRPHMSGLNCWKKGKAKAGIAIAGPALTLQCMPKRQDMTDSKEYGERGLFHHYVMYPTQPGDIIVCDARGEMEGGIFGEMMMTFFQRHGGAGVVIDGCLRDWPDMEDLDVGVWMRGVTPNHGMQNNLMFWGVNVPIACANVLVMPGDIIVADSDGAVCVPVKMAPEVIKRASEKRDWEEFTRMKLRQGEHLKQYYPLSAEARVEYEAWRANKNNTT